MRKWQKGEPVTDVIEIDSIKHFWFHDRYLSPYMLRNWQYHYLCGQISAGRLFTAVRICPYREDGCIHDIPICDAVPGGMPSKLLRCVHIPSGEGS